jgi:hypothetical protein
LPRSVLCLDSMIKKVNIVQGNIEITEIDDLHQTITAIIYVYVDENMPVNALYAHCAQQVNYVVGHYLIPEGFIDECKTPWQIKLYPFNFNKT